MPSFELPPLSIWQPAICVQTDLSIFVMFRRPEQHHLLFSKPTLFFSCRDVSTLDEKNAVYNNQVAFDILQKEFGIAPIMPASDFASSKEIDQLSVVLYLTQVHNAFSETPKPAGRCVVSTSTTFDIDLVLDSI